MPIFRRKYRPGYIDRPVLRPKYGRTQLLMLVLAFNSNMWSNILELERVK